MNETPAMNDTSAMNEMSAMNETSAPASAPATPSHSRKRRRLGLVVILIVLLAAGGAVVWFVGDQTEGADDPAASALRTDAIEVRDLSETTTISGTLAYDDARIVVAPSSGVVVEIPEEGTRLERGARLFAIDSMVADSQVTQAEQRIASAEASVAGAEIALDDLESGAGPADLASAEASVAQARLLLDNLTAAPTEAELGAAQAAVARAQETYDNLTAAPTEAELGAAQAAVARAQETYDNLLADLDPTAIAEAASAVQSAEQRVGSTRAARDLSFVSLEITWDEYCGWTDRAITSICGGGDLSRLPLNESRMVALTDDIADARAEAEQYGSQSTESDWADLSERLLNANLAYIADVAAHESALVSLDTAEEARSELLAGPSSVDVESALASLDTAKDSLAELLAGPSSADVESGLNSLQSAQERLQDLQDGPDALEVEQARSSLQSAETRLSDLLADPDTVELLRARSNLLSAELALESAKDDYDALLAGADTAFLFYGGGAAWRPMSIDAPPGPDIAWLEANLVALGYGDPGDIEVDEVFDAATADAVSAWQSDVGVTATGEVPLGQVVFIAGPAPVSALAVSRGDSVNEGAALYELTAVELVSSTVGPDGVQDQSVTAQRVTARLDLVDQDLLALGTPVLIELPDDTEVDGEVIELGAVPVIISATEQSSETSYLDVVIAPLESVDPNWTGATVQVRFATEVAQGVLSVPVSALLALQEGGYAVEIVLPDGSVRLVGVSTGLFADGFVEVAGNGLAPDLEVVIP
ncbi:MAG: peptidoglycan-binding protein [Acidimicrobiaceae bacterium]|nr:peptidoglycan-binding protein [Acidimicrobiaceae bacterium]